MGVEVRWISEVQHAHSAVALRASASSYGLDSPPAPANETLTLHSFLRG